MKRILVVDDDPAVRNMLTEVLQERYAVIEASNGAEALDAMRQGPPDAVVLDMVMPVMDGWTFLRAYRTQPRFAQVPVMVVSAEPTACEDSRRLGAQACVPKPFDLDSLASALDRLVGGTTWGSLEDPPAS
jgi:two-component system, chemotaxis family, chemotaxis protein CheY